MRLSQLLATWFGAGYAPVGPGTAGTLATLPLYAVVVALSPPSARTSLLVATTITVALLGVWASQLEAQRLGDEDPSSVVIDESAGVLLALCFVTPSLAAVATAVALFRVFDIAKPWPISAAEHAKPVGLGIMLDDLVAGLAAGLLTRWLFG